MLSLCLLFSLSGITAPSATLLEHDSMLAQAISQSTHESVAERISLIDEEIASINVNRSGLATFGMIAGFITAGLAAIAIVGYGFVAVLFALLGSTVSAGFLIAMAVIGVVSLAVAIVSLVTSSNGMRRAKQRVNELKAEREALLIQQNQNDFVPPMPEVAPPAVMRDFFMPAMATVARF